MSNELNDIYEFGPFQLDPHERLLLRDAQTIALPPKAFDVLLTLVLRSQRLVTKDELLLEVWPDSAIEEGNITSNISILRKALGDDSSEPSYIETVTKRGYRFLPEVRKISPEVVDYRAATVTPINLVTPQDGAPQYTSNRRHRIKLLVVSLALFGIGLVVLLWLLNYRSLRKLPAGRVEIQSPADVAEIKKVVRDSQIYEDLTLYTSPQVPGPEVLYKYWLPVDEGGKEITNVINSVKRLQSKDWHYGKESRIEVFDFIYVRIFAPGNYAEAGTLERWYLPLYQSNETRVPDRNVYLGPYTVDYTLRKLSGRWLIEETTTPRAAQSPSPSP